jgi:hypothetical protein
MPRAYTDLTRLSDGRKVPSHHLPAIWESWLKPYLADLKADWMRVEPLFNPADHIDSPFDESRMHVDNGHDYLLDSLAGERPLCRIAKQRWDDSIRCAYAVEQCRLASLPNVDGSTDPDQVADPDALVPPGFWLPGARNQTVVIDHLVEMTLEFRTCYPVLEYPAKARHMYTDGNPYAQALAAWAQRRHHRDNLFHEAQLFLRIVCQQNCSVLALEQAMPQAADMLRLLYETAHRDYWQIRNIPMSPRAPAFDYGMIRKEIPDFAMTVVDVAATVRMLLTAFLGAERRRAEGRYADPDARRNIHIKLQVS